MSFEHNEQWLRDAGYKHQCFISYPRNDDPYMKNCAYRVQEALVNELSNFISSPSVFMDRDLKPGMDWKKAIKGALCKSIAMVALCTPMYYKEEHRWCGLEWAAMDVLCKKRLPGETVRTIIPLIVRLSDSLPPSVSELQYIDISKLTLTRGFHSTNGFRACIGQVVQLIGLAANAIVKNEAGADCDQFEIPPTPAFLKWGRGMQPLPFRSTGR